VTFKSKTIILTCFYHSTCTWLCGLVFLFC